MTTTVIYTESQPGTVIYAFPKNSSLANWNTERVQLVESASPNQGRWTGSLTDGEWAIFEGSSQPAGFHLSVWSYKITPDIAGSGARTVTITVNLSGLPVEGATVRLAKLTESYSGQTNVSGQIVFNVDDGTWVVSITHPNTTFSGASLVVNSTVSQTYSLTPVNVTAPTIPGTSTGYGTCVNAHGSAEPNATCVFQMIAGPGAVGLVYSSPEVRKVADSNGLVQYVGLIQGARYRYWKIGSPASYKEFTVPLSSTFQLPELI